MLTNFICNSKELKKVNNQELKKYIEKKNINIWVSISNVTSEEISFLKETFKMHPTTIEDIFSQQTRVKYEEFEDYTLIIFKGIKEIKKSSVETYNISFVMGENFVITVNGNKDDIIEELSKNEKRVETLLRRGKDHIVHSILDKEVDKYLKIKSELGEELKHIEREFMENQNKDTLTKIYSKELNLLELRQLSESTTDLCLDLTKPADNYINNELIPYFKDVYDHILKTTEGYKSMLGRMNGIKNMYASITSLKTNEVMRFLTMIMALMMPLTIITGFYGMNISLPFQDHPSIIWFILAAMIAFAVTMIIISKKIGWSSKNRE
ncbi:Cobalt/magnesium transport protein CorA [uncultured archaeon]|nr:Cobalt/magnesium transport protein CorA [uncultured archaeon]